LAEEEEGVVQLKSSEEGKLATVPSASTSVLYRYVSCSADLGRCAITQKPLVTNQTFIGLVPDIEKVSTVYLYYIMTNSRNELNVKSSGTTISYLSRQQFEKFEIQLPNLKEQQKIASCLSSLDEVLTAHSQKLELLKEHKKGLMQNLFPGKGEKAPKYRFPEFVKDGEWVEKKISELGEIINVLTGKSGEDFGAGKPYVTYKQVFGHSFIDFSKCGRVKIDMSENQNTLQKGDILFTTSSETPNEVGFASVLIDTPEEPTYLNSFCFSLRPFDLKKIEPEFSRHLFHSPIYRKSISVLAQGSTRYNISKRAFLNLKLHVPKLSEQQKIASCLSSLDNLITAQAEKIKQLKLHKKGLMQGLFPKMSD
jgi:restriction endonuclease S subunit